MIADAKSETAGRNKRIKKCVEVNLEDHFYHLYYI